MTIRRVAALCAVVCLSFFASCSTHGIPGHGGGKRFFIEQRVVTEAAKKAVEEIKWENVGKDKTVQLLVTAMGDQGGGSQAGGNGGFFAGIGEIFGMGAGGVSAGTSSGFVSANFQPAMFGSYAFANANDVLYLEELIAANLEENGVRIATRTSMEGNPVIDGTVHVLVHEYGTDQSQFSALIYSEDKLKASTSLEAVYLPMEPGEGNPRIPLGSHRSVKQYKEAYFLGFGPLNPDSIQDIE